MRQTLLYLLPSLLFTSLPATALPERPHPWPGLEEAAARDASRRAKQPAAGVDRSTPGPLPPGGIWWDDGWGVIIVGGPCVAALRFGDFTDADGDGVPDACDTCPEDHDPTNADSDDDGVGDACDTCPHAHDPTNADSDGDGVGDACEE